MGLSWWHILIVLAVFMLLFGAGRISGLMGDIAKGLKSFNKAMAEEEGGEQREAKLIEQGAKASSTSRSRTKVSRPRG